MICGESIELGGGFDCGNEQPAPNKDKPIKPAISAFILWGIFVFS
jgi:hypothetical protein